LKNYLPVKLINQARRLKTIVEKGEKSPQKSEFEAKRVFDDFIAEHEEWAQRNSFVIFRDHKNLKGKPHALVERFQKSGLCYMHACVVVQHYLVAMNHQDVVPMLNMAEYLKKYMSSESLYDHIWNNRGGDSLDFLEKILKKRPEPENMVSLTNESLVKSDIGDLLQSHGPGLVSGFLVVSEFIKNWQH
jgi:hypothetical protein